MSWRLQWDIIICCSTASGVLLAALSTTPIGKGDPIPNLIGGFVGMFIALVVLNLIINWRVCK